MIQIPLSNTLRMVRTDNQSSNIQNFSNRLLYQEDYTDYNDRPYAQKIKSTDNILIQFSTDSASITAKVYDITDTEVSDESANITTVLESTSFTIYNLQFSVAAEGFYYLVLEFDDETHTSEIFEIDSFDEERMIKIEYNTSQNDGITYLNDETFVIWIEGRLVEYDPSQEKESYTGYNESKVTLNAYPTRKVKIEFGFLPRFMVEKLNLAVSHEVFKVNDVEYFADGIDAELMTDDVWVTNMYKGSITLEEVDYESYTVATDDVAPEIYPMLFDSSIEIYYDSENYIKYK